MSEGKMILDGCRSGRTDPTANRVRGEGRVEGSNPSPSVPPGYCQCGCGERAPIARYNRLQDGIKRGQHCRFIKGHFGRTQRKVTEPPNPSGLCQCGCGERAPLATRNRADKGIVKGQPVRYCPGHDKRGAKPLPADPGPNPSGLCMCGCGEKTSLAPNTDRERGKVRGKPMRFLKGHDKRGKSHPPSGKRLEMIRASRERGVKVVEEYRQGVPLLEIAERHGFSDASSVGCAVARARAEGESIERRKAPAMLLDDATVRRFAAMWKTGATASQMRGAFGWTKLELSLATSICRRRLDVPLRSLRPTDFTDDERRALRRAAKKVKANTQLSDRKRTLIRLVQAADRPISCPALTEIMCLLGWEYAPGPTQSALSQLRRRALIASVPVEQAYRDAPRVLWFVPLNKEQPAAALTLADATRETELAALIRAQEEELARGAWAQTDYKTVSLDANFSVDGGTFHDILAASDEPFKAGAIDR